MTTTIKITKRGNALGFTAAGRTVVGAYSAKTKTWRIWTEGELGPSLSDPARRNFATHGQAAEYAATLIDDEATERLAWW